jgi:hypothetical protein
VTLPRPSCCGMNHGMKRDDVMLSKLMIVLRCRPLRRTSHMSTLICITQSAPSLHIILLTILLLQLKLVCHHERSHYKTAMIRRNGTMLAHCPKIGTTHRPMIRSSTTQTTTIRTMVSGCFSIAFDISMTGFNGSLLIAKRRL